MIVWSLLPVAFIVSRRSSARPTSSSSRRASLFTPTLDNYADAWQRYDGFFATMGNSLIVAIGATVLAGAVSFFAGFAYSRYRAGCSPAAPST